MRPGSPDHSSAIKRDDRGRSVSSLAVARREKHDEQPSHEDHNPQTDREGDRQLLPERDERETHDTDADAGTDRHGWSPRALLSVRTPVRSEEHTSELQSRQ